MIVEEIIEDFLRKYMQISAYWQLYIYFFGVLFTFFFVKLAKKKRMNAIKCVMIILLFCYLETVYVSTVLAREHMNGDLLRIHPFISWKLALSGSRFRTKQVIENIIMLMPIGIVLPLIYDTPQNFVKTILFGTIFSLFIEISQYVRQVGFFETEDIINNTLGVIIGCGFVIVLKTIASRLSYNKYH